MASRSSRRMARARYRDEDDYDDDELTPEERRLRLQEQEQNETSTVEWVKFGALAALPIGVPILAAFFRPLAGFGPNLSLLWTVLLALFLLVAGVVAIFAIPKRRYYRTTFLMAGAVAGYVVVLTVMGLRAAMVVGWDEAKPEEEEFSVAVPAEVEWKEYPGNGEFFNLEFGGYVYIGGFRDLSSSDYKLLKERILEDSQPLVNPFLVDKAKSEDGTKDELKAKALGVNNDLLQDTEIVIETYEIEAQNFPGRRFIVRGMYVADVYLVNQRLYFLMIVGDGVNPSAVVTRKFLSSFRLIDPPAKQEGAPQNDYLEDPVMDIPEDEPMGDEGADEDMQP